MELRPLRNGRSTRYRDERRTTRYEVEPRPERRIHGRKTRPEPQHKKGLLMHETRAVHDARFPIDHRVAEIPLLYQYRLHQRITVEPGALPGDRHVLINRFVLRGGLEIVSREYVVPLKKGHIFRHAVLCVFSH